MVSLQARFVVLDIYRFGRKDEVNIALSIVVM